ncbi:MAG: type I-E CRISPR-associated protein Cas5/CasD [FCB group bacterium]|nr:type I-E CRISPR-associated protein Cas5/CasD [FCB group bacterium]
MNPNTLFLRLEGPMQAWGAQESKFVIRRTTEAPTKSGVIGLLCAALGVSRSEAARDWLDWLSALRMGVRIDRPGIRWWDYHTVGAKMQMRIAAGGTKLGAMLTRREYLCDASFLVALQGEPDLIANLFDKLGNPKWTLYLGRKCCPPSCPIAESSPGYYKDLLSALKSVPYCKRFKDDEEQDFLNCLLDWIPTAEEPEAPFDALVCYDVPDSFEPPSHHPRFVIRESLKVGENGDIFYDEKPLQKKIPSPLRTRADYGNSKYRKIRNKRLDLDYHLCVFCKAPANTVQHITYKHAGGGEGVDELRTLCRLCHDAVTMIEYGRGMGMDRINPEDERWHDLIIKKRAEIIKFRSLETRRRRLESEVEE